LVGVKEDQKEKGGCPLNISATLRKKEEEEIASAMK